MWIAVVLMVLMALFMLLPGGYWIVRPEVPGWAKPWMLWPLRSTGRDVLRLQGWAAILIGVACVLLIIGLVASGVEFLSLIAMVLLVVGMIVWAWSVAKSFAAAKVAVSRSA